jgi:protoheme IX farnesyltransferase
MRQRIQTLADLTKARLASLVVVTAIVGFVVARPDRIDPAGLAWTTLGTALAALGANGFNQCLERQRDARMLRTRTRPLPSGRLTLRTALLASSLLSVSGILLLAMTVNLLTAGLALLIHVLYLWIYTPMKLRSPGNTLVGAICGAIPPVMGWTAATGTLSVGAGLLFLVLFAWQMPHFLALAWLYREDYERGGYRMLPAVDRTGALTGNLVVLYSAILLPLALAFLIAGLAGWLFLAGGLVLGTWILVMSLRLRAERTDRSARRLFLTSLAYLPLLLGVMVLDRGPAIDVTSGAWVSPHPPDISMVTPARAQASMPDESAPEARTCDSSDEAAAPPR